MRYLAIGGLGAAVIAVIAYQIWMMIRGARAGRGARGPAGAAAGTAAGAPAIEPWVEVAAQLVVAARGDTARLRELLAPRGAEGIEIAVKATITLITGDELAVAELLARTALALGEHAAVHHQLATIASMRQDDEAAERHLRAASAADPPYAPSMINLAGLLARRADPAAHDEAVALADRAAALMPDDRLARHAPVLVRAHTGDVSGARTRLEALGDALARTERLVLERTLDAFATGAPPVLAATYPMHAEIAAGLGRELADEAQWEAASAMFRRASQLDPTSLEIAADLGFALSQLGRDPEAIAHYDRAIETIAGGALLRLNRGNARRRTGDLDGALADYDVVIDLVPELLDARIARTAALADAGRLDDARAELAALTARGGVPPEILAALRDAIASK